MDEISAGPNPAGRPEPGRPASLGGATTVAWPHL
jgi:hypothetical protein